MGSALGTTVALVVWVKLHKSLLGVLSWLPIALVSAAACGGNAFENKGGLAGGSGSPGSSAAGTASASGGSGSGLAGAAHTTGGVGAGAGGSAAGGALTRGGASSGGASNGGASNGGASGGASQGEAGNGGVSQGEAGNGGSGGLDFSECTSNAQCKVVAKSCCSCASTGPLENFTAINSAYETKFKARCAAVDCAACQPQAAPDLNDPSYYRVATCERPADTAPDARGHCVIVDLRATPITACKVASDCSLRAGTACCAGCSGRPISLNGNQGSALTDLVCESGPIGCPACVPIFDDFRPTCSDGRCGVQELPCTATHPCP